MEPVMTRKGKVDKRYGARLCGEGSHRTRGPWSDERVARYREKHPFKLRSFDDWRFSNRDKEKFETMLTALKEDTEKRMQELNEQLAILDTKRIELLARQAELIAQLKKGEKT